MAARLTLTQEVEVQVFGSVPHSSVVKWLSRLTVYQEIAGSSPVGTAMVPSSNRTGRRTLNPVMLGSNPAGITMLE